MTMIRRGPISSNSGMTKNGGQTLVANTTPQQITAWTPNAGSTDTSDSLVPNGTATGAAFSVSVAHTGGFGTNTRQIALYLNGASVATSTTQTGPGTLTISTTHNVDPTQLWAVYFIYGGTVGAPVITSGATTFLTITVAPVIPATPDFGQSVARSAFY